MGYCFSHGIHHQSVDCPRCVDEEKIENLVERIQRQAQDRHEDLIQAIREAEYKRANPGDYECPGCSYITLKRGASRCPNCHKEIEPGHWDLISRMERAAAEEKAQRDRLAAEEWAKGEPERQRLAEAAAKQSDRDSWAAMFFMAYFPYLLPIISAGSIMAVQLITNPDKYQGAHLSWSHILFLIPGWNWFAYLIVVLFSKSDRLICIGSLIFWTVVGIFTYTAIRRE